MILTAHQPTYLPWLGLFHKIALADGFVVYDDVQMDHGEQYEKRNYIKTPDGRKQMLVVPVSGSHDCPLHELTINENIPWRRKHWRSLELAYQHAPYWDTYCQWFEGLYGLEWGNLAALNNHILRWLLKEFGLTPRVWHLSQLGIEGKGSERVLNLCLDLGVSAYIFGAQGRDYADVEAFERADVKVFFQDYRHPEYEQLHGEFVSHLSVVDLLFNHGPDSLEILMSGNVGEAS